MEDAAMGTETVTRRAFLIPYAAVWIGSMTSSSIILKRVHKNRVLVELKPGCQIACKSLGIVD